MCYGKTGPLVRGIVGRPVCKKGQRIVERERGREEEIERKINILFRLR